MNVITEYLAVKVSELCDMGHKLRKVDPPSLADRPTSEQIEIALLWEFLNSYKPSFTNRRQDTAYAYACREIIKETIKYIELLDNSVPPNEVISLALEKYRFEEEKKHTEIALSF